MDSYQTWDHIVNLLTFQPAFTRESYGNFH